VDSLARATRDWLDRNGLREKTNLVEGFADYKNLNFVLALTTANPQDLHLGKFLICPQEMPYFPVALRGVQLSSDL
jgi:hypothetical protein